MISGPKADPKPAHAYPTRSRIVSFFSHEIINAITETSNTDNLPIVTNSLSVAERRKNVLYKSSVNELDVTSTAMRSYS